MPVEGIFGPPGSGKTLYAVRKLLRIRRRNPGRRIWANLPIYLPGEPVRVVDQVEEWYRLRDGILLIDEIHQSFNSARWAELVRDRQFVSWSTQLRKIGLDVWYTTQAVGLVAKPVRDVTGVSWYLDSWRRLPLLPLFVVRGYLGAREDSGRVIWRGFYLFNPLVGRMYDTDYRVGSV